MQVCISWQHMSGNTGFGTNKLGKLPLSGISLSEKGIVQKNGKWKRENTLQFMELLWWTLSWQRCLMRLNHLILMNKSESFTRTLFSSWHFSSSSFLSLLIASSMCRTDVDSMFLKLRGRFSSGLEHSCWFFTLLKLSSLAKVLLTKSRGLQDAWVFGHRYRGKLSLFLILGGFLSFLFHFSAFLKRKVVDIWSLSSFWYLEGWTVCFQKQR